MSCEEEHRSYHAEQQGDPPENSVIKERRSIVGLMNDLEKRFSLDGDGHTAAIVQRNDGIPLREPENRIHTVFRPLIILDKSILDFDSGDDLSGTCTFDRLDDIPLRTSPI